MNDSMIARNIAIDTRRQEEARRSQSDFVASNYICHGEFMIEMAGGSRGEVTKDINFPVVFIERPLFYDGGSLEESQTVTVGNLPTIGGIVISWVVEEKGGTALYRGARVGVSVSGDVGTRFWYNWHFSGVALVNPTGGSGSITTDGTI